MEKIQRKLIKSAEKAISKKSISESTKKVVEPKAKEIIKKHIEEDVIQKDFVDSKGRLRYYIKNFRKSGKPSRVSELGVKRTQRRQMVSMADDDNQKYTIKSSQSGDNITIDFAEFNTYKMSGSIYNSDMSGLDLNDERLYTKLLIGDNSEGNSDIYMPPWIIDPSATSRFGGLYVQKVENWDEYVTPGKSPEEIHDAYSKDPKNRYPSRDYISKAQAELTERSKEIGEALGADIMEKIINGIEGSK